jgi:hypothetical protein
MYAMGIPFGYMVDKRGPHLNTVIGSIAIAGGYFPLRQGKPASADIDVTNIYQHIWQDLDQWVYFCYASFLSLLEPVVALHFKQQSKLVSLSSIAMAFSNLYSCSKLASSSGNGYSFPSSCLWFKRLLLYLIIRNSIPS